MIRKSSRDVTFKCSECGQIFSRKEKLYNHIRDEHVSKVTESASPERLGIPSTLRRDITYKCSICGMETNDRNLYLAHLVDHSTIIL